MRFQVSDTPLSGVMCIERSSVGDARGFLSRMFCTHELLSVGWHWPVSQINHTCTEKSGTVRGIHFQQPPNSEAKLVSCIKGSAWDVAVDLRHGSPTFLHWTAQILSAKNKRALLISPGCAHGFQPLEDATELLYCHSRGYAPEADAGLNPLDPTLAIVWPKPITLLSDKDRQRPLLQKTFQGLIP